MKLSVTIMAHPRRREMVTELLKQLPDTPVFWDTDNNLWHTCKGAWLMHDPTADYHVVLQDDALLCDDFMQRATETLEQLERESAVCFFVGDKAKPYGGRPFYNRKIFNEVAICLPTHDIVPMVNFCDSMKATTDRDIERYCKRRRLPVYYPQPSLVDHREGPSLYRFVYRKPVPQTARTAFQFIDHV